MMPRRVALVTGGAGGIGRSVCTRLADAGHLVVVADIDGPSANVVGRDIGGRGVALDVTDGPMVREVLAQAELDLGRVDVLVNCVGVDRLMPFVETDDAFAAQMIEVNLAGPMRVARALLPGMMERAFGRIVNVSSDAGRVGSSLSAPYSAAKGGLIAFTKTIAREGARSGITANAVCPGLTDTALLPQILGDRADAPRVLAAMKRAVPMRRLADPDEVAHAIAFLASAEASFITGQTLSVSGGLTMA